MRAATMKNVVVQNLFIKITQQTFHGHVMIVGHYASILKMGALKVQHLFLLLQLNSLIIRRLLCV